MGVLKHSKQKPNKQQKTTWFFNWKKQNSNPVFQTWTNLEIKTSHHYSFYTTKSIINCSENRKIILAQAKKSLQRSLIELNMTNIFTIYLFHDKKIQIQVKILRKRGCCSLKHFPRATRPGRKMFRVRQRNAKIFIQGNDVRLLHGKQGQDVPQKYESNLQLWK